MSEQQNKQPVSKEPVAKRAPTKTQEVLKKVTTSKPSAPTEKAEVRMGGVTLVRR